MTCLDSYKLTVKQLKAIGGPCTHHSMLFCQAGRQFWVLDTEATEEVEEDWISRW